MRLLASLSGPLTFVHIFIYSNTVNNSWIIQDIMQPQKSEVISYNLIISP